MSSSTTNHDLASRAADRDRLRSGDPAVGGERGMANDALTSYTIKLPWTSPPLTLNQRLHYRVKAKLTKEIRDAAFLLAKHHKIPKHNERIRITLIYHPTDRRRRDAINLTPTLKAFEDGIVDAQIVPDDTPTYIDPVMPIIADPIPGGRLLAVIDVL